MRVSCDAAQERVSFSFLGSSLSSQVNFLKCAVKKNKDYESKACLGEIAFMVPSMFYFLAEPFFVAYKHMLLVETIAELICEFHHTWLATRLKTAQITCTCTPTWQPHQTPFQQHHSQMSSISLVCFDKVRLNDDTRPRHWPQLASLEKYGGCGAGVSFNLLPGPLDNSDALVTVK